MSAADEQLEDETPVFTQYEAYLIAYGVAHFLVDEPDWEEVTEFIDGAIPRVLASQE